MRCGSFAAAREDTVHPRLRSGDCGRLLNFTVRRPPAMRYLVVCASCVLLTTLVTLKGCAVSGLPEHLLTKLQKCLNQVSASTTEGDFTSPCVHLDVTPLNGATIAQLSTSLGPPGISSDDYIAVPPNPNAPYECRWAFYRIRAIAGGGPELQCVSEDRVTCKEVRWAQTL